MPEPVKENYLISILYQMDGNIYVTLAPYFNKVIKTKFLTNKLPYQFDLVNTIVNYCLQSYLCQ